MESQTTSMSGMFLVTGTAFEIFLILKIAAGEIRSHNRLYINMNNQCS